MLGTNKIFLTGFMKSFTLYDVDISNIACMYILFLYLRKFKSQSQWWCNVKKEGHSFHTRLMARLKLKLK